MSSVSIAELAPFENEAYTDFTQPKHAAGMRAALAKVRSEFGREYPLRIAGGLRHSTDKLKSLNPSNPAEVVGVHHKGSEKDAIDAVESAYAYFPKWSAVPVEERARLVVRLADVIRQRKYE